MGNINPLGYDIATGQLRPISPNDALRLDSTGYAIYATSSIDNAPTIYATSTGSNGYAIQGAAAGTGTNNLAGYFTNEVANNSHVVSIYKGPSGSQSGSGLLITMNSNATQAPLSLRQVDSNTGATTQIDAEGGNGQKLQIGYSQEEITLNTGSTTTDSTTNLLPTNSMLLAVTARVTVSITTASTITIGNNVSVNFAGAAIGTTFGDTTVVFPVGAAAVDGSFYTDTARKIRLTTNVNPGAGKIRVTVHYFRFIASTI